MFRGWVKYPISHKMKAPFISVFKFLALIVSTHALAGDPSYFSPQSKRDFLLYFKHRLYAGCADLKAPQSPISPKEMGEMVQKTKINVLKTFNKSFKENSDLKNAYLKELDELSKDVSCQRDANDCRSRILGLSIYYYHQLRADIPNCDSYVSQPENSDKYNINCEGELRYRKRSLEGIHGNQYGNLGPGNYKKQLLALKNQLTKDLFDFVIREDKNHLHICNPVREGVLDYKYTLETEEPGEFVQNLDPVYDPRKAISQCKENAKILHNEMILAHFDDNRNTVGRDQFDSIKKKIVNFLKENQQVVVTDVTIESLSSRTPYYVEVAGKKVIDKNSDEKNLKVVKDRATFGQSMLEEIRTSSSLYNTIKFESVGKLAGPEFSVTDLNERFVTKMSPGYFERIEALYSKHQDLYKSEANISTDGDLLSEEKYSNLYQAKFKPFHGFKVLIKGVEKNNMKCASSDGKKEKLPSSRQ